MKFINILARMPYAVLTALISVVSASVIGSDFLSIDDSMLITHNPLISLTWANFRSIFTWPMNQFYDASYYPGQMKFVYYRPLLLAYYMLNASVWGFNPVGFHVSNILLHLLTTFLVFRIAILLFDNNRGAALLAAALFSVHPVHNEVIGRVAMNENLLALFMTASLYFWLQGRRPLSLLLFVLALLTKESAVMLPLLLLIFNLNRKRLKEIVVDLIPYVAILLSFLVLRSTIVDTSETGLSNHDITSVILRSFTALALYLKLLVFPGELRIFYPEWKHGAQVRDYLSTLLVLTLILYALWRWRAEHTLRVLLTGVIILLVPVIFYANNIILGFDKAFVAERQLYIPSIFFSLFIAAIVWRYENMLPGRIMTAAMLVAIPFSAHKLATSSAFWKNDNAVYTIFTRDYPESFLARRTKAAALYGQGDLNGALAAYQALLHPSASDDHGPRLSQPIVSSENRKNDLGTALAGYQVWLADLHFDMGLIHMARNDLDAAIRKFRVALILQPYFYGARVSLARAYMMQGRYHDAAREYNNARKGITLIYRDDI
jgi:tetratricopeptide (TPR) repeat protein